uniref:Uncharacterized protein n=1 Tax=Anguilla anguilla TaxID=7936 RepID=A0A0E9UIE4_ANGAN
MAAMGTGRSKICRCRFMVLCLGVKPIL